MELLVLTKELHLRNGPYEVIGNFDFSSIVVVDGRDIFGVEKRRATEKVEKMITYIVGRYTECGSDASSNYPGSNGTNYNAKQEAVWAVINSAKGKNIGDKYTSSGEGDLYYRLVGTDKWQAKNNEGDTDSETIPGFVKLYKEAAEYLTANKNVTVNKRTGEIVSRNANLIVVGPYEVTYNSKFVSIDSIKVGSSAVSTDGEGNIFLAKRDGEKLTKITSGEKFYFAIKTSDLSNLENYSNKNITIKYKYTEYSMVAKELEYVGTNTTDEVQKIVKLTGSHEASEANVTVTLPTLMVPLTLKLHKTDNTGSNVLNGITFTAKFPDKTLTGETAGTGDITFAEYEPASFDDFNVEISENSILGFKDLNPINLKYHFDGTKWVPSIVGETRNDASISADGILNVKNTYVIEKLVINKTDGIRGNSLANVPFNISLTNCKFSANCGFEHADDHKITGLLTDDNGKITIPEFEIENVTDNIVIEIEEASALDGYKKLDGKLVITLKWTADGLQVVNATTTSTDSEMINLASQVNGLGTLTNYEINLNIKNTPLIKLDLTKIDSVDNTRKLAGVKFKFDFENCKLENSESSSLELTTGEDGKIPQIDDIVITGANAKITITEITHPTNYAEIEGSLVLGINWKTGTLEITPTASGDFADLAKVELSSDKCGIELEVKNIPLMTIAGVVFIDKPEDGKIAELEGNGEYGENDTPLSGVEVNLYRVSGDEAILVNSEPVITNDSGNYKFEDVQAGNYYVEFNYNGMKYQTIAAKEYGTVEDVENKSNAEELAANRDYIMKNYQTINDDNSESSRNVPITAKVTGIAYQGEAVDGGATSINLHVNCGLKERYFDLELGLDINQAEVSIKGESTTYEYGQILTKSEITTDENGNEYYKLIQSKDEENANKEYNLYLYDSDYTYRKNDYVTNPSKTNKLNNDEQNTINQKASQLGEELSATVTYKAIIHRQSKSKGYATKLINTYDSNFYTLAAIKDVKNNFIIRGEDNNWYKIEDMASGIAKALTEDSPLNCSVTTEGIAEINIPFYESEIEGFEENEQQIILYYQLNKFEENATLNNPVTLEIAEYYTEEGIIDYDSTPNNRAVTSEDDDDTAKPLVIGRKETSREISGNVFEDLEKDGNFNNSDQKIPNILVQLVEVLNLDIAGSKSNYEYIWQEALTDENGNYIFKDVLPGNYIVRFVYGDKEYDVTKDLAETAKYNALDYKSTYSNYYNLELKSIATTTKAFDNEARRVEQAQNVMNGTEDTWMCADTPVFTVNVDDQIISEKSAILKIQEVDLGLMQRPKEEIVLVKNLIGLKIIGTDGTTFINYDEENKEENYAKLANKDTKSTRTERGSWTVQFEDIDSVNANLTATYEYKVKNVGEKDWVFKEDIDDKAITPAERKSYTRGTYLADYYYTGNANNPGGIQTEVTVKGFEEIVNPNLSLPDGTAGTPDVEYEIIDDDGSGMAIRKASGTATKFTNNLSTDFIVENGAEKSIVSVKLEKTGITGTNIKNAPKGELGLASYVAELTGYTNNGGKRFTSTPGNLKYNHSTYSAITMESYALLNGNAITNTSDTPQDGYTKMNESDECWAETIILTQNFGEDKQTPVTIILIITASVAVLGVGIILIKKFAIK